MSTTPRLLSQQSAPADAAPGRFRTLQYQPTPNERWYHVLFGHVPRYQMDFIIRPELPIRKFRPQHFAHLGPQIKFLCPASGQQHAVAIANLSSNDTQHVPGRGGIAVIVSMRVADLRDHAQRESPVFAHSLIAIDEPLDTRQFSFAAECFVERVLAEGLPWYRGYYSSSQADNFDRVYGYIRTLRDLPPPDAPGPASEPLQSLEGPPPYNQLLIDCRGVEPSRVVRMAARLGVLLYRSNLKWTVITTGSEEFETKLHQGEDYSVAVRLLGGAVSTGEIERQVQSVGAGSRVMLCRLAELPESEAELGAQLFGLPGPQRAERKRDQAASSGSARPVALRAAAPSRVPLPPLGSALQSSGDGVEAAPVVPDTYGSTALPANRNGGRRPLGVWSLVGCGLLGIFVGGAGVALGLRQDWLRSAGRPGHTENSPKTAAPLSASSSSSSPPDNDPDSPPSPPATDAATPETRRLLVTELRHQAAPLSSYADTTFENATKLEARAANGNLRHLIGRAKELQRQLDKTNYIADGVLEDRSRYNISNLVDSYCLATALQQEVKNLEKKFSPGGLAALIQKAPP